MRETEVRLADGTRQTWNLVDTGGGGRGLVLLPGSVGTCELFHRQVAQFGGDVRVVAVTYPAETHPARLADGLAGLLDALALEAPDVLGSSFAAYWLQAFALRHPGRFRTLVLGNGFFEPSTLFALALFEPGFVRRTPAAELQRLWLARVEAQPEGELRDILLDMLRGRQTAETLKSRFLGVIDAVRLPRPPAEVEARLVILECEDDPLISAAARAAMRAHLSGAKVITLESGGHYPHILATDAYNAALRSIIG